MCFSARNTGAGLEYPVKHAHHHLLVELRALLQHSRTVEILQTEQVCAALCALGTDLRCVDLGEALAVKELPETSHHALLDAESRPLPHISKRDGPHVQLGLQGSVELPFGNGQRQRRSRL